MRVLGWLCIVVVAGLLAGCINVSFTTKIAEPPDVDAPITGLDDRLLESAVAGGALRLLAVHGMGPHGSGWSHALVDRVVERLDLEEEPVLPQDVPPASLIATALRRFVGTRKLKPAVLLVYEVSWSGVINDAKRLALSFDNDARYVGRRIWLNAMLKRDLVNDRFADPLMYLGAWRDRIRDPVEKALDFIESKSLPQDRLAALTLSLGSKIIFDVFLDRMEAGRSVGTVFGRLASSGIGIYMLANQLPLLELGTRNPTAGIRGDPALPARFEIVALNDPNDLLTYAVTRKFLEPFQSTGLEIKASNVQLNVEPEAILGLVANPLHAHTDHDRSKDALDFIAFGRIRKPVLGGTSGP